MQELTVIRAEHDHLIVATESGDTFSLPIDERLRAEVRRTRPSDSPRTAPRVSPRDIQAHIRAGMSTTEVAELLGATTEDVERFQAPVLAEREHMLGLALAVPVLLGAVDDQDARPSFGEAIRAKLEEVRASGERWTSWKDPEHWVVKLEFQVGDVDHDARWSFDQRRSALAPLNADATQLSRQGSLPEGLIPRLRALDAVSPLKDDTRFDSGAFGPRHDPAADIEAPEPVRPAASAVTDAAIKRAPESNVTSAETADLLDALRRRRGQREPAPDADSAPASTHSPIALFDALEPGFDDLQPDADTLDFPPAAPSSESRTDPEPVAADAGQRRRGRSALPTWDEIVFGARGDGD